MSHLVVGGWEHAAILGGVIGRSEKEDDRGKVGLCADCRNARRVESDRGSIFWRCELSLTDPRFPKYPRLPVLACSGYDGAPSPS
jgi:hypothetical protein